VERRLVAALLAAAVLAAQGDDAVAGQKLGGKIACSFGLFVVWFVHAIMHVLDAGAHPAGATNRDQPSRSPDDAS
jgi:hypothetical protein